MKAKSYHLLVFGVSATLSSAIVWGIAGHTSRITQSHHGLFHSATIYQILNGLSPPTNPLSIEAPANYLLAY